MIRARLLAAFVLLAIAGRCAWAADKPEGLYGKPWPGISKPYMRVPLASKVYENIREVMIQEGQRVRKGELLIQYDDSVVSARTEIARREIDLVEAKMAMARLRMETAWREYNRQLRVLGSVLLTERCLQDWQQFSARLAAEGSAAKPSPGKRLWDLLPEPVRATLKASARGQEVPAADKAAALGAVNDVLTRSSFYQEQAFAGLELSEATRKLLSDESALQLPWNVERLNRMLLEAAFPELIATCGPPGRVSDTELDRLHFQAKGAELELTELERDKALREANLDFYKAQEEEYKVLSPLDGVVSCLHVEAGQTVREGQDLIEIIVPEIIKVWVGELPEEHIGRLKPGQPVKVVFPKFSKTQQFDGEISVVAPEIAPHTFTFEVTVTVKPGTDAIKPGADCTVEFIPGGGR
jgi:multidrug resistance efflux pump